ncbi:MAG: hypothetical protein AVDCRST_MAG59-863, partial [uncultured Thermomicrobiales bacterium]
GHDPGSPAPAQGSVAGRNRRGRCSRRVRAPDGHAVGQRGWGTSRGVQRVRPRRRHVPSRPPYGRGGRPGDRAVPRTSAQVPAGATV